MFWIVSIAFDPMSSWGALLLPDSLGVLRIRASLRTCPFLLTPCFPQDFSSSRHRARESRAYVSETDSDFADRAAPFLASQTGPSSTFRNPQAIGYILNLVVSFYTMGHSALVYALHAALEERARQPITTAASQSDVRAGERIALLQQQVHGMALNSARQLATAFDCLPSLPHISHFRAIRVDRWAQLLLDAVSSGVFTLEDAAALRS